MPGSDRKAYFGISGEDTVNKKIKLRKLVDRWAPSLLVLFPSIKILERLKRLGYGSKEDGWRKATQSYLRTEHSKFTLAVFRLNIWSDSTHEEERSLPHTKTHIIERLSAFLIDHPIVHRQLHWGRFSANRKQKDAIDIVCAGFDEDGKLSGIQPHFDKRFACFGIISGDQKSRLNTAIIREYNRFKDFKDERRPRRLKAGLLRWMRIESRFPKKARAEGVAYIDRVLNSSFIYFEILPQHSAHDDPARFRYPDFIQRKHPGFGIFNICCRLTADHKEADMWFQISHIPIDGVPMQEILNDLKARWKTCGDLEFPAIYDCLKERKRAEPELCSTEKGKAGRYHTSRFIDFRPLLKKRKELNDRYADRLKAPITVISMLGWGLAHHETFADSKFLFPVDLPSHGGKERTLGFVAIRPSVYFNTTATDGGFPAYQAEFNRRLYKAQARISEIHKLFNIFALSHPAIYWLTRRFMQPMLSEIVGSVVITTIRDADLFIAPSADIIIDGFIAFGNCSVPTRNNEMAGLVSVKSSKEKTAKYISAVEDVIADFGRYL